MTIRFPCLVACLAVATLFALAPSPASAVKRRVFVTSVSGTGDLWSWPGSSGTTARARADSICRTRATFGGLPNANTYRAWISDQDADAYCHVQGLQGRRSTGCNGAALPGGGPWYLSNGLTPWSGTLDQMTGPRRVVYRGIVLDEYKNEIGPGYVWTGTQADGDRSLDRCGNWDSTNGGGSAGRARWSAGSWTDDESRYCSDHARLLCVEPGPSEATPVAWSPAAIAFVTSASGKGDLSSWPEAGNAVGLEAGDQICRTLATQARLPHAATFVAWLSDGSSDAIDRLPIDGPFRRLDTVLFAIDEEDLTDGFSSVSLHVDERGRHLPANSVVYTGTRPDGLTWDDWWTCDQWTSGSSLVAAAAGNSSSSRDFNWTSGTSVFCSTVGRLYCFQGALTLQDPGLVFEDGFESGTLGAWGG